MDTHELEKIRKGMVYNLIRKKSFDDEKTIYYYQVLEAKIVLGDDLVISIATEFIENEKENVSTSE